MPAITLIVTNAGRALLPSNGGIGPVQLTQLGLTQTAVVPNAALTALAGEFKRINTVSGAVTAPDTISLGVLDETNDTYDLRGIGLYSSTGVLFAVAGQADPMVEKAAQSNVALTLDLKFADIAAAELEFGDANFLLADATTERKGLIELATDAEVAAKLDSTRAVTAKSLWFAFSAWVAAAFSDVWRASNDGSGSGLDADLLDGLQGAAFLRGDSTANAARNQAVIVAAATASNNVTSAPITLREVSYVNATQNSLDYAPGLAFLWNGHNASLIRMKANGEFVFVDNGGNLRSIIANIVKAGGSDFGVGGARLNSADTTYTGFVDFVDAAGNRRGFIGYAAGNVINIVADGLYKYNFNRVPTVEGADIWHPGNDGSGSGLDADLLDGLHLSQILRADTTANPARSQGVIMASHAAGLGLEGSPVQLREVNYAGAGTGDLGESPAIAFHWQGRYAASLRMDANGHFRFVDGAGSYREVRASAYYALGGSAQVWHSGNDGAGSGLDADLLDGQHGSYYADIPARLGYTPLNQATFTGAEIIARIGYTPLNQASYTAADVLSKLLSVDGSGSGLDADLLDGADSSYFTNIPARLGYTPLNQDTFTGAEIIARIGYTPLNQASYTAADVLSKLLSVDGSGSGLDADLLDGHHASDFVLNGASSWGGDASAGWRQSPDGFIEQWKQGSWDAGGSEASPQTIYFPITFPNNSFDLQVTTLLSGNNSTTDVHYQILSFDHEKCVVLKQRMSTQDSVSVAPRIRVIGR